MNKPVQRVVRAKDLSSAREVVWRELAVIREIATGRFQTRVESAPTKGEARGRYGKAKAKKK